MYQIKTLDIRESNEMNCSRTVPELCGIFCFSFKCNYENKLRLTDP